MKKRKCIVCKTFVIYVKKINTADDNKKRQKVRDHCHCTEK